MGDGVAAVSLVLVLVLVLDLIRVLVLGWWIEASPQDRRGSDGVKQW
jgi:hypothetical protein